MTIDIPPATSSPARQSARIILVVSAFLLPTLSLIPLGGLYLWEKGWMLWWAAAALVAVGLAVLLQRALLNRAAAIAAPVSSDPLAGSGAFGESEDERLAWQDVRAIAIRVDVDTLDNADAIIALGQRTVDAVARRLHPERADAVWRFTLPQALAISERVSARLGDFVETRIPFGDRLTVAQLLSVYGWRRYIGVAEQAYDVWRVVRMANPATAVTQEARERLSRSLVNWGKEHVSRRIAEAFVEEVGRAAIDLYGGRLPSHGAPIEASQDDGGIDASRRTVVVVGGDAVHRDAIAADLEIALAARNGVDGGRAKLEIAVSDAIGERDFARRQLTRAVSSAGVVVWIASAATGPTHGDEAAMAALRRHFATAGVVPPAVVVAASHAPTDAASDLARYVGVLAQGLAPGGERPGERSGGRESLVVAVAATGAARSGDMTRLAEAAVRGIEAARQPRATAARRTAGRRGIWASAGQAASAVGGLAGALLKPRSGERGRDQ